MRFFLERLHRNHFCSDNCGRIYTLILVCPMIFNHTRLVKLTWYQLITFTRQNFLFWHFNVILSIDFQSHMPTGYSRNAAMGWLSLGKPFILYVSMSFGRLIFNYTCILEFTKRCNSVFFVQQKFSLTVFRCHFIDWISVKHDFWNLLNSVTQPFSLYKIFGLL